MQLEKWKISLQTLCLISSAYFLIDGFIKVVGFILELFSILRNSSGVNDPETFKVDGASGGFEYQLLWRFGDGIILLTFGYLCVLGLENGRLNLLSWPTLLIFIYKVVEYLIEQITQQLYTSKDNQRHCNDNKWTSHFLLPSMHLLGVTIHLWKSVQRGTATYAHTYTQAKRLKFNNNNCFRFRNYKKLNKNPKKQSKKPVNMMIKRNTWAGGLGGSFANENYDFHQNEKRENEEILVMQIQHQVLVETSNNKDEEEEDNVSVRLLDFK